MYFLVCKGLSNDDVGVERGGCISRDKAWNWFKNRRFVKEKLGLPENNSYALSKRVLLCPTNLLACNEYVFLSMDGLGLACFVSEKHKDHASIGSWSSVESSQPRDQLGPVTF